MERPVWGDLIDKYVGFIGGPDWWDNYTIQQKGSDLRLGTVYYSKIFF